MKESIKVSVVVITYNSAATIIETLESIRAQSYQNIELVITDDASSDQTVKIAEKWLAENKSRFVSSKVLAARVNQGVAPNFNCGARVATGQWIKIIAGDDILLPECLEENVKFVESKPEASFVFSKSQTFRMVDGNRVVYPEDIYFGDLSKMFFGLESDKQYKKLLKANYCSAPTAFFKRDTLIKLGSCDESFPMLEDYPLWLKATKAGYRLYFLDKTLVLYRLAESASNTNKNIYNLSFIKRMKAFKKKYTYPEISKFDLCYWTAEFRDSLSQFIIIEFCANRRNILTNIIWLFFFALSAKHWRYSIIPGIRHSLKTKSFKIKELRG